MKKVKKLPDRSAVRVRDTWDLSSLFSGDDAWEAAFTKWEKRIPQYARFCGKLGRDGKTLAACLRFDVAMDRAGERLGTYAFLKTAEDTANPAYQRMHGRFLKASSRAAQAASYIRPEILSLPAGKLKRRMDEKPLTPYRLLLDRLLRYKPHTLGEREERLLAMQTEMAQATNQVFRQLNDADLKFPPVKNEKDEWIELSHATLGAFLHSPKRSVRRTAFTRFYEVIGAHENTLAATLNGSIQRDVYYARARNHENSLSMALFPDRIPVSVYENLIEVVHHLRQVLNVKG